MYSLFITLKQLCSLFLNQDIQAAIVIDKTLFVKLNGNVTYSVPFNVSTFDFTKRHLALFGSTKDSLVPYHQVPTQLKKSLDHYPSFVQLDLKMIFEDHVIMNRFHYWNLTSKEVIFVEPDLLNKKSQNRINLPMSHYFVCDPDIWHPFQSTSTSTTEQNLVSSESEDSSDETTKLGTKLILFIVVVIFAILICVVVVLSTMLYIQRRKVSHLRIWQRVSLTFISFFIFSQKQTTSYFLSRKNKNHKPRNSSTMSLDESSISGTKSRSQKSSTSFYQKSRSKSADDSQKSRSKSADDSQKSRSKSTDYKSQSFRRTHSQKASSLSPSYMGTSVTGMAATSNDSEDIDTMPPKIRILDIGMFASLLKRSCYRYASLLCNFTNRATMLC